MDCSILILAFQEITGVENYKAKLLDQQQMFFQDSLVMKLFDSCFMNF
jgi:hypothetical protein